MTKNINGFSTLWFSKGSSDQYVRDYSRTYGLKTVVLECLYLWSNQWAQKIKADKLVYKKSLNNSKSINIFGNGKQVRDVLYIDDLIRLYEIIFKK